MNEARFEAAKSNSDYQSTWDRLRGDIEAAHADALAHQRVLSILSDEILAKAERTFELSLQAYRVGRISFQQLIDNYESLLRFRLDYHRHRSEREQSLAQLEFAVGTTIANWQDVGGPQPAAPPAELPLPVE